MHSRSSKRVITAFDIKQLSPDLPRLESLAQASLPAYARPHEGRSRNMSAIRSKNTMPELFVRRALHRTGFRFRLHPKHFPGNPDLVLPRFRTAIFVHGCFWHGHDCRIAHKPKTNSAYWSAKISRNRARDSVNAALVEAAGWQCVVIKECALTDDLAEVIRGLNWLKRLRT
jgi:DNA mismatch endonuclease, patch repair protein